MPETKAVAPVTKEMKALQLDIDQVTRTTSILNPNQIQKLWNSTRAIYKYQRPARGGGTWTYVKTSYVRKVLDSVFGFNWDFDVETTVGEAFEVAKLSGGIVVKGILTVRTKRDGEWHTVKKVQFGRAEVKWKKGHSPDDTPQNPRPLDIGNDYKAACSDALKKCASLLGLAQDVYEPDEFMNIDITGSDEASDKQKSTAEKIEAAKKVIKQQSTKVKETNDGPKKPTKAAAKRATKPAAGHTSAAGAEPRPAKNDS